MIKFSKMNQITRSYLKCLVWRFSFSYFYSAGQLDLINKNRKRLTVDYAFKGVT